MNEQIEYFLKEFQEGDYERAFFGLIEMDVTAIPELIATFHRATSNDVRAFLVHVIWQFRSASTIVFLREALQNFDSEVWKEAIDGLVALASRDSLAALCDARLQTVPEDRKEFQSWLEEAIQQTEQALDGTIK